MKKYISNIALAGILASTMALNAAPRHDKSQYVDYKNEFMNKIDSTIKVFESKPEKKKKKLFADVSQINAPKSIDEFTKVWYNEPISQGNTGTCWSFASTSFLESEAYRLYKKEYKFSEMYTAYCEYIEKAKEFVKTRGKSAFAEGSQANAPFRIWQKYGCVPAENFTGMLPGQEFHAHAKMFSEMNSFLQSLKQNNAWNEDAVVATIKSILNHYMGTPPTEFTFKGKKFTPKSFLSEEVKINTEDYVSFMSLVEKPYFSKAEYEVEDNWWHCSDFNNIPLDDFMNLLKKALKEGFSVSIGGDVSEAGYCPLQDVAIIPTFDIPSEYIDEHARQFRFDNGTTTDDHGIHVVGYTVKDGTTWFLIKDSGSGSRNGNAKGYYYYHEDYVKLKMMNFSVHKSVAEEILKKIK